MKKAPLALVASLATVLGSFFVFDAGASAAPAAGKVTVKLVCDRNVSGESTVYFYDASDSPVTYVAITCNPTGKRSSTITTTAPGAVYASVDTNYTTTDNRSGACGGQQIAIPGNTRCETLPDLGVTLSVR